jgi:hypothetical protein
MREQCFAGLTEGLIAQENEIVTPAQAIDCV